MNFELNDLLAFIAKYTGLAEATQFKLFKTVMAGTVLYLLLFLVRRMIGWRVHNTQRRYIANKTAGYLFGFFFTLAAWRIWLGGGLVAYIGIVSAGLAIALKDPLTNLAGWLFISVRKPFGMGDRIQINQVAGDVIDQRPFAFSVIEIGNWVDADQSTGRIIHIPNGWVFIHAVANYTQGFNFIWNEIPILITFESDWRKAKDLLSEIGKKHSSIQSESAAQQLRRTANKYLIYFTHLTPIVWTDVKASGVMLTIRYLCEPRRRRSSSSAIWEEILAEFAKHPDINLAYPTQRFYTEPPTPPTP
ncbi:MAG: mechanosensitive ion channel family protein [Kiritimatiellales bacterium]|nr:mechanosensitive ion channel family protein [Kiritimatiellales bacterium]